MRKKSICAILVLCMFLCACGGKVGTTADTLGLTSGSTEPATEQTTAPGEFDNPFEDYAFRYESGRERDWEVDVVCLANSFLTKHPKIADAYYFEVRNYGEEAASHLIDDNRMFDRGLRNAFIDEVNALITGIPEMSDVEIQYELQRIVAMIGDSHSSVTILRDAFFPVMIDDLEADGKIGYYTLRIPKEHENVLYTRLTAINGVPLEEVVDRLRPYISSENEVWEDFCIYDFVWNSYLIKKDALQVIGIVPEDADSADFEFTGDDGSVSVVTLSAITAQEYNSEAMAREDFYAKRINYRKYDYEKNYWYEVRAEDRMLYMRVSACTEISGYAFSTYCGEILQELNGQEQPLKLVIDLRGNTGGSYPMSGFEDFVEQIQKVETDGIFVLIDHGVFSSGNAMAGKIKAEAPEAVFVGTPTGQPANLWGSPRYYNLVNSQLAYRISTQYWTFSETEESTSIVPDVTVYQTLEDYKQGIDTVLEAVKNME